MPLNERGRKKSRGSILLLSFFFLIVLLSLSVAFFKIIPAEFHSADTSRKLIQANYASDAGGHHAVAWLKYKMNATGSFIIPDSEVQAYNVANFGSHSFSFDNDWPNNLSTSDARLVAHKVDDNWSFLSRIRMDDSDFFRRIYTIESCSYLRGKPQRVAKLTVQNESFADFALYVSDWDDGNIYTMGPNGIQGPVHTNTFLRLAAPGTGFWTAKKADGSPQDAFISGPLARITQSGAFRADSTSPANTLGIAGDGVQYANGNSYAANWDLVPYNQDGSPNVQRYEKIVENGRDNITQVDQILMPEQNNQLREQAWGSDNVPEPWQLSNFTADGDTDLLINTDSGKANDPSGKVKGGIFIGGYTDASDVLLDITPEGHQKIRVRQGSVKVETGTSSYKVDVKHYQKQVEVPGSTYEKSVCTKTTTVSKDIKEWQSNWVDVTKQNGAKCGYRTEFIPGENGVSQTVQVANTCTYPEDQGSYVVVGQEQVEKCVEWGTQMVTSDPYMTWVDCDPGDAGATYKYTTTEAASQGDPGAYEVVGEKWIQEWNSVVEVNDSSYKIPYYEGVKVNGVTITDPNDSRLLVADGNTVKIHNDYSDNDGNYAEYTVMEGRTNGVVYSDVNLWNVRGTNKGAKYKDESGNLSYQGRVLAANVAKGKDLEIQDSILQYYDGNDDKNDGSNRLALGKTSPNSKHILGLAAEDIWIDVQQSSKNYENTDTANRETNFKGGNFKGGVNVYAIIMAGRMQNGKEKGAFKARDNDMEWNDGLGDFNLFGGIISAESGVTQKTDNNNPRGFRLSLNYDPVAAEALKYFPSTSIFSPVRYVTFKANAQ